MNEGIRPPLSVMARIIVVGTIMMGAVVAILARQIFFHPPANVSCAVLDQFRNVLDGDISAGIDGVRADIGSMYSGIVLERRRDAETKLGMVDSGVHDIQGINPKNVISGMAPRLESLARASDEMRDAVELLFTGWADVSSIARPQPETWEAIDNADRATWEAIDNADRKKDDVYALVNDSQRSCTA